MQNNFTDQHFPAYARALQEECEAARRALLKEEAASRFCEMGGTIEVAPPLSKAGAQYAAVLWHGGCQIGAISFRFSENVGIYCPELRNLAQINRQISDAQDERDNRERDLYYTLP